MHRQHLAELQKKLDQLHPADVAYILEALPLEERLMVWDLVKADRDGEILLEVSDAVRETLIANMDAGGAGRGTEQLDTDEIADLAPDLPRGRHRGRVPGAVGARSASSCAAPCRMRRTRSAP